MSDEKPIGLEHQTREFTNLPIEHEIIIEHQKAFPELAIKMKNNPKARNIYAAFLAMMPLQIKGLLTEELKQKILKKYRLV